MTPFSFSLALSIYLAIFIYIYIFFNMYICIHVRVHTISFIALNSFLLIPSNEIIFFNYFSITHLYIILLLQLNGSFYFSYTYTYTHTRAHTRTRIHTRAHIYTYSRTFFHYLLPSPLVVPSLASSTLGLIVSKMIQFSHVRFREPLYNLRWILRKLHRQKKIL